MLPFRVSLILTCLLWSCNTPSILSRSPVASASRCLGSSNGWFAGIIFKEMSNPPY